MKTKTVSLLMLALAGTTFAQTPQGLDALDDSRVLTEVAGRGLDDLLRHAFDRQGVPEPRRAALLARASLNRLSGDEPLPAAERRRLVLDVAQNVDRFVEQADDPQLLLDQAQLVLAKGVNDEVRLLEYFGDNPDLRRQVGPVSAAVGKMLESAATLFEQRADAAAEQIRAPGDAASARWQELDASARRARDLNVFADYHRVLSLDPDDPKRLTLADETIAAVKPADSPRNPRRSFVQSYLGKLALARGNEQGFKQAREYLDAVIQADADPAETFDAHFFRVAADIEDRKLDAARDRLAQFQTWFQANESKLPDRAPLMIVLEYRLADAAGRYAPTDAAKREASARATQLLIDLVDRYEGYRPVVTEQLLARVGPDTDLSSLPPLVLDAVVDRGRAEAAKLAGRQSGSPQANQVQVDRGQIERGVAAAKELLRRAESGNVAVEPAVVARNAFLLGLMQDLLGDRLAAAETFVGYPDVPGATAEQSVSALRRALGIVEEIKRRPADESQRVAADALEGRLLPLLVGPPVNDKGRAFDLANRLHRLGRLDEAITFYGQVPDSDPRLADALYFALLANAGRAAELPAGSPEREAALAGIPDQGRRVLTSLQSALSTAANDAAKSAYRERVARTKVMLARAALSDTGEGGPAQAQQLLADIESDVSGLPAAESILADALPLRFQAVAAAGRIDAATDDLLALLRRSDPPRGLAYIAQFRDALNDAMDRARARQDAEAMRQTTNTRAAVTPRLVEFVQNSDQEGYRRYLYNFQRFNAETQYQAATLAEGNERQRRLREALAAYEALASPEGLGQYRDLLQGVDSAQAADVPYDREVVLALGNIHYELAKLADAEAARSEYEAARSRFARLLADRAVGGPTRVVEQDGLSRSTPNEDYFEVSLRFIQTNLALGNAPAKMADELRKLYIVGGEALSQTRWADEYEALRRELGVEAP